MPTVIHGIPGFLEDYDTVRLEKEITNKTELIANIKKYIRYADSSAYSRDLDDIRYYTAEIKVIENVLNSRANK